MVKALIFIFEIAVLVLLGFICSELYLLKNNAPELTDLHITAQLAAPAQPADPQPIDPQPDPAVDSPQPDAPAQPAAPETQQETP